MGLRESKKDQTRYQLLDAALRLIEQQGYQQTTVNEIAAAVNVSPRTFLRYFPTKDDVVVGWLDHIMGVLPAAVRRTASDEPIVETLFRSAREMLNTYQAKGAFLIWIEDIISTSATLQASKQQRIEALAGNVSHALRGVYGERYSDMLYDIYGGAIVALTRASIGEWQRLGNKGNIVEIFDSAKAHLQFVLKM